MGTRIALRSLVLAAAVSCSVLGSGGPLATPAAAAPGDARCALTADGAPPAPAPGAPCWVDVEPYPFGSDGNAIDPSRPADANCALPDSICRVSVSSLAFRAWNRGLAAVSSQTFRVWQFNGARWFPDPTFPGAGVCAGDTVLWAGKLDYWLVGNTSGSGWPALCRFDGADFSWQPITVPAETVARAPATGSQTFAIRRGACFAWDDCWFFGDFGAVVRWDGSALTDASPNLFAQPWLGTSYTAAAAARDASGRPIGAAAGDTGPNVKNQQVPGELLGASPPQLFASSGGPFSPLGFRPTTAPQPRDPARTDLVAVDVDARGRGWVAGNPVGYTAQTGRVGNPDADDRRLTVPQPAPIEPFASSTDRVACAEPAPNFEFSNAANGRDSYLWASLSVFEQTGAALAGGRIYTAAGAGEPVLAHVGCDGSVATTRFRRIDTAALPGSALVPASPGQVFRAVAANAGNDAWAAAGVQLYRLTDSAPPDAPTGDDVEERPQPPPEVPQVFEPDPDPPSDPDPPPEPPPALEPPAPVTPKPLRAAIHDVRVSKPKRIEKGRDRGRFAMIVRFRVRRPITVGVQAVRRGVVVSRSGVKRFRGTRGKLTLTLHRRRWPTGLRFYDRAGPIRTTTAAPTPPAPGGGQP